MQPPRFRPLAITATTSSLPPLRPPKFTPNATSRRLHFPTNLPLTTTLPPVLKATTTRITEENLRVLPLPFPAHVSPPRGTFVPRSQPWSWSVLRLPLAAARISPIACSSTNSYPSCDDDEFDLIVHKVLVTTAKAVGTVAAFIVAVFTFFRHSNEFVLKPNLSSLIGMFCGIWEFGIAVRVAYLMDLNAKMRMDCHPKIVDDGHIDTLLLFILKELLMLYASSCLLKAGSPPCLVLVLIILRLMLNQVSL